MSLSNKHAIMIVAQFMILSRILWRIDTPSCPGIFEKAVLIFRYCGHNDANFFQFQEVPSIYDDTVVHYCTVDMFLCLVAQPPILRLKKEWDCVTKSRYLGLSNKIINISVTEFFHDGCR